MAGILSLERTGNEAIQQIQLGALFLGELSLVARNALIGGQRHALPHPPAAPPQPELKHRFIYSLLHSEVADEPAILREQQHSPFERANPPDQCAR